MAAASLAVMYKQLTGHAIFACSHEDSVLFVNWVRQVADSLASGVLFPRWMPESHGGYGSPTFIFYPPLVIYLTALINLATGDLFLSVAVMKVLALFLSGLFMYVFIRDLWGFGPGLASAFVYMLLPFRVFDLYYLGVYASKFAYVWFPLIPHFSRKGVVEQRFGAGTAGVAVTYGLQCLTHLLSAYMFTPVLVLFGLIAAGRGNRGLAAARLATGCALGIALSAFYILPVIMERAFVHFDLLVDLDINHYWNQLLVLLVQAAEPSQSPSVWLRRPGRHRIRVVWGFPLSILAALEGALGGLWARLLRGGGRGSSFPDELSIGLRMGARAGDENASIPYPVVCCDDLRPCVPRGSGTARA